MDLNELYIPYAETAQSISRLQTLPCSWANEVKQARAAKIRLAVFADGIGLLAKVETTLDLNCG